MEPPETLRALSAATSIVSDVGLKVQDAIVLQNANRLVVRLVPCDVLARVAVAHQQDLQDGSQGAAFELRIAQRLANTDSPVGRLDPRVGPLVYVRDGFTVTYWEYYEHLPNSEITPIEYAQALESLHIGMRQLDVTAPHFTDRVEEALMIVRDRSQSPELVDSDRELLNAALQTSRLAITSRAAHSQLLHGEPHAGNLLRTKSGMRFVDLETCCYGPVEFDIAHAPDKVGGHYTLADPFLLRDCRILKLAMVAAWRSDRNDQFPDGRQAREKLISLLREAVSG